MRPKFRIEPRISANKLAEYMSAGPTRRRAIIADQIVVPATKILNYEFARVMVRRIMADPAQSAAKWIQAASRLRERAVAVDEFEAKCLRLSAQALEAFAPSSHLLRIRGAIAVPARREFGSLNLSGVRVTVSPDVSLIEAGTERQVGAIKFHFPKTSLKAEGLQYVAAMIHQALSQSGDAPRHAMCIAADAFSGSVLEAPRAMKTRMRDLANACEEIAERWKPLYAEQVAKDSQQVQS